VAGWLVLACASGTPAPKTEHGAVKSAPAHDGAFPPTGPIELRPAIGPPEGTLYQLLMSYEGRTEVADDRPGASPDATQSVDEKTALELDFRQEPVATPGGGDFAWSLLLEALKRRALMAPPGGEHVLEIGDDRLRVAMNDKVETDLRGAQPKQNLTPRTVLGKSFALIVSDATGNPKGITIRGLPAAKKMLATLPLRESLGYMQIAYPDRPVSPGDTWHAKRFFPNPIGRLGLAVDVELRLVGFERIDSVPCAHVVMRANLDDKKVPSEVGFTFDEARYQLAGDAWFDLDTGQVVQARVEDVAATLYRKTAAAMPARVRMRYEGRSALKRLDSLPGSTHWADGSKRFGAVN
jgi:hypothetical protein